MNKAPFIGIAGNIGVGKTTFTEVLSQKYNWKDYYESVIDNPYLSDFYQDMNRWSFNLQIYFLQHRFASQIEISKSDLGELWINGDRGAQVLCTPQAIKLQRT